MSWTKDWFALLRAFLTIIMMIMIMMKTLRSINCWSTINKLKPVIFHTTAQYFPLVQRHYCPMYCRSLQWPGSVVSFCLQSCVAAFLDVVIGGRAVETPPMSSMNLLEGLNRTAVYMTHNQLFVLVRAFAVIEMYPCCFLMKLWCTLDLLIWPKHS